MKTLITIVLFSFFGLSITAQTRIYDYLLFDSLNINSFYLGESIEKMIKIFGEPTKEYIISPQPDCEEWCEKNQKIFIFGNTEYIKEDQKQRSWSDCKLKELLDPKTAGIITAFELNSSKNVFILNYMGYNFYIGDKITEQKFKAILPNGYDFYTKTIKEGKSISYIKAYLSDTNKKITYNKGVEFIMFHFDKSDQLSKINIDYPKE